MIKILSSASKLMFLLIGITACIGFASGLLSSDNFMILAVSAFSYYFTKQTPVVVPKSE